MADMDGKGIGGFLAVARGQRVDQHQMFLHHRHHQKRVQPCPALADQPDLDRIDAIGVGNDRIAEIINHGIMETVIQHLRRFDQLRCDLLFGLFQNIGMGFQPALDVLGRGGFGKMGGGFAFQNGAELKGIPHQIEIDIGNLHPALRHGADQPFGFEPRNQLADRPQCQAGQCHKLPLRDELAGGQLIGQQVLRETGIGLVTQLGLIMQLDRFGHKGRTPYFDFLEGGKIWSKAVTSLRDCAADISPNGGRIRCQPL